MLRMKTLLLFPLLVLAIAACGGPTVEQGAATSTQGSTPPPPPPPPPPPGTPPDSVPPSVPTNLLATPGVNAIGLTWSASTDNVGVTGYIVRRNGTPVATSTATTYVVGGLAANTSYTFTVSAVDAAGNASAQTPAVTATTLASGTASALAQLAALMQPGQWADFTTGNFNFALIDAGGGHSILEFAARGHWDPVHKKIQFWGMGHVTNQGLITYDDATNTWLRDPDTGGLIPNQNTFGHGYQHLALNPATGDLYQRTYDSGIISKKPYGQPWQTVAPFDNSVNNQVAGALEWVPQLNGGAGGLAFADTGGVRISNSTVSSWGSQINAASGAYQNEGVAINGAFYFGGGANSAAFWRLNANGTITDVADPPVAELGITHNDLVPHPNGIDALLVGPGAAGGHVYRYNATADTWTDLGPHQLTTGSELDWWVGITVPEYGVIVWLCETISTSEPFIRVYKPN